MLTIPVLDVSGDILGDQSLSDSTDLSSAFSTLSSVFTTCAENTLTKLCLVDIFVILNGSWDALRNTKIII